MQLHPTRNGGWFHMAGMALRPRHGKNCNVNRVLDIWPKLVATIAVNARVQILMSRHVQCALSIPRMISGIRAVISLVTAPHHVRGCFCCRLALSGTLSPPSIPGPMHRSQTSYALHEEQVKSDHDHVGKRTLNPDLGWKNGTQISGRFKVFDSLPQALRHKLNARIVEQSRIPSWDDLEALGQISSPQQRDILRDTT